MQKNGSGTLKMELLSTQDVAEQLSTTARHVSRLCREARLRAVQKGRAWFVDPQSVVSYVAALRAAGGPWSKSPRSFPKKNQGRGRENHRDHQPWRLQHHEGLLHRHIRHGHPG